MSQIERRRHILPNLSATQSADNAPILQWGSGADMIPIQEVYFSPVIYNGGTENALEAYMSDGASGTIEDMITYDHQSGVIIQEERASNVLQMIRHKLWSDDVANSVGVREYGIQGRALVVATLLPNVSTVSTQRALKFQLTAKYQYALNMGDYLPFDKPFPALGGLGLRSELLIAKDAISAHEGGNSSNAPVPTYEGNPLMLYDNYKAGENRNSLIASKNNGSYKMNYWGTTHNKFTYDANSSASSFVLTPGIKKSVQGVLIVPRLASALTDTANEALIDLAYDNFEAKTIQLQINGELSPTTPMIVGNGDGTTAATTNPFSGAEGYRHLKHLAKVFNRGSKHEVNAQGQLRWDINFASGAPTDYFIWVPLSDMNASHGSGVSLSDPNINLSMTGSGTNAATQLDIFVFYDKVLSYDNGLAQVSM